MIFYFYFTTILAIQKFCLIISCCPPSSRPSVAQYSSCHVSLEYLKTLRSELELKTILHEYTIMEKAPTALWPFLLVKNTHYAKHA